MKFIIVTDSEELVEEIRAKVDRMGELDTHAMEKNPEKLADKFTHSCEHCPISETCEFIHPSKKEEE